MSAKKSDSDRKNHLQARYEHKIKILDEGGEQAISHSIKDIRRITAALKRLEEGQYGLCCNCGVPIAEGRLDAIPETPFCTDCAKQH